MQRPRKGFTLVELVAVVAIVAVLAAILLSAITKARDRSQTGACQLRLKDLAQVVIMYSHDNEAFRPGPQWQASLGDYCDDPRVLLCPADPEAQRLTDDEVFHQKTYYTSYGMNYHALEPNTATRTVLIADAEKSLFSVNAGDWHYHAVVNDLVGRRHPNCVNAAFLDGHVERLSNGLLPWMLYTEKD